MNKLFLRTFSALFVLLLLSCAQTVRQDELVVGIPGNATDKVITFDTGDGGSNAKITASDSDQTLEFSNAAFYTKSTGTTVGKGGVGISPSSGVFNTSAGTEVDVTNLSVTITTSGNPVKLQMMAADTSSGSRVVVFDLTPVSETDANLDGRIYFFRDTTKISQDRMEIDARTQSIGDLSFGTPCGTFHFIDDVAAGTYTYKVVAQSGGGNDELSVVACKLTAYEL